MRFNVPPGWPVAPDWSPPPGWLPPADWPPAPPGWQYWVAATKRAGRLRRPGLLIGALAGAVVLLVAVVGSAAWLTRGGGDAPARPTQMLAGSYPSQPQVAWSRRTNELVNGPPSVLTELQDLTVAAVTADRVILRVRPSDWRRNTTLLSLGLSDGHTQWSVPAGDRYCAGGVVNGMLACVNGADFLHPGIDFIDIDSGRVVSTYRPPFYVSTVATDGSDVYLFGHEQDDFTVSRGSPVDPVGSWRTRVSTGSCQNHSDLIVTALTVDHGLVHGYQNDATALLHASDGSSVTDHAIQAVNITDSGDTIVTRSCRSDIETENPSEVLNRDGRVRFSTTDRILNRRLDVHTGGRAPLLTETGDGIDATSGHKLWHITTPPYTHWLVGSVLIAADSGGLAGYDVHSGRRLWHTEIADTFGDAVTDGAHFIISEGPGLTAYDVATGSAAWNLPGSPGSLGSQLIATDAGLLVVCSDRLVLLRPTGPPAVIPSLKDGQ